MGAVVRSFLTPPVAMLLLWFWWLLSPASRKAKSLSIVAILAAGLALGLASDRLSWAFALLWGLPTCTACALLGYALLRRPRAAWVGGLVGALPWLLIRTTGQIGDGMMSFGPRWQRPDALVAASARPAAIPHARSVPGVLPALSRAGRFGRAFADRRRDSVVRTPGACQPRLAQATPRLAASDRRGLVLVRRGRRSGVHAGAARRERVHLGV